jgi:hypothetical protein
MKMFGVAGTKFHKFLISALYRTLSGYVLSFLGLTLIKIQLF